METIIVQWHEIKRVRKRTKSKREERRMGLGGYLCVSIMNSETMNRRPIRKGGVEYGS